MVEKNDFKRLDVFLKGKYPDYSRTYFKKLIENGCILVNGNITDAGYKVKPEDKVDVDFKDFNVLSKIEPENISLDIIYEDNELIVINKPSGMVVHPACGNYTGTLVNALAYHFKNLPTAKDKTSWMRPGLVHRLDKETSGVMLVAKTENALYNLSKQFENRKVQKTYLAICYRKTVEDKGKINIAITRDTKNRKKMVVSADKNAKEAITYFEIIKNISENIALVKAMPKTGRTHQIRVHFAYIGLPILGDTVYGVNLKGLKDKIKRTMLHSYQIEFAHPKTNKKINFVAELPKDFFRAEII